ncbi:RraA family protein [Pseudooceanicola sp. CBS1P-1]|uniref:Putative 4-hydroxy-4-methyl-2-oxoglutarate aldolase n=1 Tax=Pseudooceanicola albus TaxID=2692189 RepID=A0A6L7G5K2_9RHOB|nr:MULTISPECIES: RraA family protein [Pseudooceanicola]MBT9386180.1 RraA family protein [Pseudooceanicola endophyticus]MXN19405.1 RraA family protein [Pseudooceanicola albus]
MSMTETQIDALVKGFATCAVANVSDNLNRMVGARGLLPYHRGGSMCGRALTVRTAPGDNAAIHRAFDQVRPGDVVVVDGAGYLDRALTGGIMAAIARSRGAVGLVVDGAIRDVEEIAAGDFPVFARGISHLGPYKNGPGEIGVPVSIGGMLVSPGDIVLGDADGIVAFAPAIGPTLLEATRAQARKEAEIMAQIAAGTYIGAYAK